MRLIDADAFEKEARSRIDMQDLYLPIHIKEMVIDEMPIVDAVPVRRGKWMTDSYGEMDGGEYLITRCSCCGEANPVSNYCPNCGADMRGDSNG